MELKKFWSIYSRWYSTNLVRNIKRKLEASPSNDETPPKCVEAIQGSGPPSSIIVAAKNNTDEGISGRKSIVVSRLHPTITGDKITDYIKAGLEITADNTDFKVISLDPRQPAAKHYDKVTSSSFWPAGINARDFELRPRKPNGIFLEANSHQL